MMPFPLFRNVQQRLESPRALVNVATPPEERLDRISAFAAKEFGVPMALISLVDGERPCITSRFGVDMLGMEKDKSFFGYAITGSSTLMVQEARDAVRFADHPMDVRF